MTSNHASNNDIHSSNAALDTAAAASTPGDNTRSGEASQSTTKSWQRKGFREEVGINQNRTLGSSDSDDSDFEDDAYQARRRSPGLLINTNIRAGTGLPNGDDTEETKAPKEKAVSWRSLPRKDQLLVLALARLSEPLAQTSLGSYLFYQLQSFDPSLPDATIASQAGIISAAFPFSQFLTAILWGRFADSERGGRKRVIFIGLLGTMLSMIGFGFSQNFATAIAFRCLGGVLNGNIGVMRTMISEIIKEKKFQSRAFILLPMTFNIGVIVGPILGGLLANPVASYPSIFGPGSRIGGKEGVEWMKRWPYALPNLMCAMFLFFGCLSVFLFLEETSELCKDKSDPGLRVGRWIRRRILRQNVNKEAGYMAIPSDDFAASATLEMQQTPTSARPNTPRKTWGQKLPFRRIWTRNLIITFFGHGTLAMHVGGFNSLWYIFLSTPRFDPARPHPPGFTPHGFIHFTGGLGLAPSRIGLAGAILGVIGISLQLFIYPKLSHRLGTATSFRTFLVLFPITYALAPFLSRIPGWSKPPDGVSGPFIWIGITVVLFIQVLARTFALPCTAILINNNSPHPSVLGTVHAIGQSVSSLTRTFGPILFAWVFGKGLDLGVVALGWWLMASVAVLGLFIAQWVKEGDGHEIVLDGEVKGDDGTVKYVG